MITDTDTEVKSFLETGAKFFSMHCGKNGPNILVMLADNVKSLDASTKDSAAKIHEGILALNYRLDQLERAMKESSHGSGQLAKSLNRITLWYAVITAIGVAATLWGMFHPNK